nr:uncharacterized protein LOC117218326 [Megalopta genalis]
MRNVNVDKFSNRSVPTDGCWMWSVRFLAYPPRQFATMKFLLLCAIVAITACVSFCQNTFTTDTATCSPWLGICYTYDDCCRYLACSTYRAKCVPITGPIIPGQDQRPIGPGPYPPNFPRN